MDCNFFVCMITFANVIIQVTHIQTNSIYRKDMYYISGDYIVLGIYEKKITNALAIMCTKCSWCNFYNELW